LDLLLALVCSGWILATRKRAPPATLAWILSFFFLPYLGFGLFLLVGYRVLARRKRRKPQPSMARAGGDTEASPGEWHTLRGLGCDKVARLAENLTGIPVIGSNRVLAYEEAFGIYGALTDAIRGARHHIHLEYYIFEPDDRGAFFRDLLAEKAAQGVQCRLLVDNIGSFGLRRSFIEPLRRAGGQFAYFGPVHFTRPWGFHLRNHRKIAVIDGRIGFIGSQNIGGEWRGDRRAPLPRGRRHRAMEGWRDTQVRIEGPAVQQLQTVFAEDWLFTTGESLEGAIYFPLPPVKGESLVQTLPTGPDESDLSLEMILINLIPIAEQRITVTTPYFIPSGAVTMALESAARRGVRVEILVPQLADHRIVQWASRSWFAELLRGGSQMWEYPETFLHAKVVTIDDKIALLGSANMDMRSFRLNFECSLLVYDRVFAASLVRSFDAMRSRSQPLDREALEREGIGIRLREGLSRLLSPLL
jgi:cardiolipin synthase